MTGSATLEATTAHGLTLKSLEFKVGDANFGALELKEVDVSYTLDGEVWKGEGELQIPAGGGALDAKVSVEFDKGNFVSGSLDVGLRLPGHTARRQRLPTPQLYLSHGGLGLGLSPAEAVGHGRLRGHSPGPPGEGGGPRDYAFSLDGELSVAFGKPVTITLKATGFLYKIELGQATLTYKIPSQAELTGRAHLNLGIVEFEGQLGAIIDAKNKVFGALIETDVKVKLGVQRHPPRPVVRGQQLRVRHLRAAPGRLHFPVRPLRLGHRPLPLGRQLARSLSIQGQVQRPLHGRDPPGRRRPRARPRRGDGLHGAGTRPQREHRRAWIRGAPSIVLVAPDGRRITPSTGQVGAGETAQALQDANTSTTYVGIQNPSPGSWGVEQAAGSPTPITGIEYSIGEPDPKVKAKLKGNARGRTLHYHATLPANVKVTLVEQAKGFSHVIGQVRGASGTIHFRPAFGPVGRRQIVAQITEESLPMSTQTLGSFVVPRPPRPGRAKKLHVSAKGRALSFSFTPPANSAHTLLRIVATDGRHLQQIVPPRTRHGSVPAIGFRDGITVTVIGLAEDGSRGPAVKASARQVLHLPKAHRPRKRHH